MWSTTFRRSAVLLLVLPCAPLAAQAPVFTAATFWQLRQLDTPDISADGKQIAFTVWTADSATNDWVPSVWQMESNGNRAAMLVAGREARWSPDGTRLAWIGDSAGRARLMVRELKTGTTRVLVEGMVAPEEIRWSPDGTRIAYAQRVAGAAPPASPFVAGFAAAAGQATLLDGLMAAGGDPPSTRRHLFIVPADSGAPRDLTPGAMQVGSPDVAGAIDGSFSWFPDGRHIAFGGNDSPRADREAPASAIWFVKVADGAIGRLTAQPGFWHSPVVSPDGRWVAYTGTLVGRASFRSEELFIMQPDGTGVRSLTPSLQRDPVGVRWAPDNQSLWFSAQDGGAINVYTATVTGASVKTATNGNHSLVLGALTSKDGGYGLGVRSGLGAAPEIVRFSLKKPAELRTLSTINQQALARVSLGETEELSVPSGDVSVQGLVFRPPAFDPARRYPLVVELHDGPHAMFAAGFDPAPLLFAARGYLVLRLNPRGSTGFGTDFARADTFPGSDVDDLLAGLDAVIATGVVDTARISLHGCGAGAVTALEAMVRSPRFGRSSIDCTGGDWLAQGGAPRDDGPMRPFFRRALREDPLVWAEHSPVRFASSIRSPLLVLAGACDLAAPFGIARPLHAALVLRRVESVLMTFEDACRGTSARPGNWVRTLEARVAWYGGARP